LARNLERNLPVPQSALAQALLLGLRGQLPPQVKDDFRATGTSHLLAISGLHVGVLLLLAMGLVSLTIGRRQPLYFLVPLAVIWIYALTSGMPASVVRAGIMGITVLAALALGRPRRVLPALSLAAAIMVGIDPKVLGQVSFQLSFAAVAGIALVLPTQPRLAELLSIRTGPNHQRGGWLRIWLGRWPAGIATTLLVSAAATLATWPLVAYNFQQIPWMGIPVTMLALPALPFALLGSLASALAGLLHPAAGQLFGWMAWLPLTYMLKLVSWMPHFTTSGGWVGVPLLVGWYGALALGLLWPGGLPRLAHAAGSLDSLWDRVQRMFGEFGDNEGSGSVAIPWI
jgi:competence protein ComEC